MRPSQEEGRLEREGEREKENRRIDYSRDNLSVGMQAVSSLSIWLDGWLLGLDWEPWL